MPGLLTPQYLADFETEMKTVAGTDYDRLLDSLWWDKIAKRRSTGSRREILTWLLASAQIEYGNQDGGTMQFDQLASMMTELVHQEANAGFKLHSYQLDDTDGNGWELGTEWSKQITQYAAYWPQKQTARFLKEAHNVQTVGANGKLTGFTAYDGLAFFALNHPVNPFNPSAGVFANLFTGTAGAGGANASDLNKAIYPGAVPIDITNAATLDVAIASLTRVFAYITSLVMPNGEDPRQLHPMGVICAPALGIRANNLFNAKFIAANSAGGGGGSTDIEGVISSMGFQAPLIAPELATFESGTTYFVVAKEVAQSEIGALVYTEREPFKISYYNGAIDAQLDRIKMLEWHLSGRNSVSPGHPYHLFKCKAT
jgi:hypothetical protein